MAEHQAWPDELNSAIGASKPETRQDLIETPVAKGPPKQRPRGSPYAVLVGELELSPEQRRVFDDFFAGAAGKPFWIPTGENRKLVAFQGTPVPQGDTLRVLLRVLPGTAP